MNQQPIHVLRQPRMTRRFLLSSGMAATACLCAPGGLEAGIAPLPLLVAHPRAGTPTTPLLTGGNQPLLISRRTHT